MIIRLKNLNHNFKSFYYLVRLILLWFYFSGCVTGSLWQGKVAENLVHKIPAHADLIITSDTAENKTPSKINLPFCCAEIQEITEKEFVFPEYERGILIIDNPSLSQQVYDEIKAIDSRSLDLEIVSVSAVIRRELYLNQERRYFFRLDVDFKFPSSPEKQHLFDKTFEEFQIIKKSPAKPYEKIVDAGSGFFLVGADSVNGTPTDLEIVGDLVISPSTKLPVPLQVDSDSKYPIELIFYDFEEKPVSLALTIVRLLFTPVTGGIDLISAPFQLLSATTTQ